MLIIAGHFEVDPEDRDRFVSAHQGLLRRARTAPGCLDLAITADQRAVYTGNTPRTFNDLRRGSTCALNEWPSALGALHPRSRDDV